MFLAMFLGGSTGSTTGGIKMARHLISMKNLSNAFIRIQHPNAVIPIKLNGKIVSEEVVNQVMVFITLYLIIFLAGNLIMQLTGISVLESSGASATCMAGIGPGLGASGNHGQLCSFQRCCQGYNDAVDDTWSPGTIYIYYPVYQIIQAKLGIPVPAGIRFWQGH